MKPSAHFKRIAHPFYKTLPFHDKWYRDNNPPYLEISINYSISKVLKNLLMGTNAMEQNSIFAWSNPKNTNTKQCLKYIRLSIKKDGLNSKLYFLIKK